MHLRISSNIVGERIVGDPGLLLIMEYLPLGSIGLLGELLKPDVKQL
jgi:hypothetical protein